MPKVKEPKVKKVNYEHKLKIRVVEALLKNPKGANWGLEIKLASKLIQNFPDARFWRDLTGHNKFNSLLGVVKNSEELFYLGESYQRFITENLEMGQPIHNILTEDKLGEDQEVIKQTPKSILDFVNKYA